jgi:hypothetical protein
MKNTNNSKNYQIFNYSGALDFSNSEKQGLIAQNLIEITRKQILHVLDLIKFAPLFILFCI